MQRLFAAHLFSYAAGNILQFDSLPVNAVGSWFGTGSLQARYSCSDPSTPAGLEECLTVLLAPKGLTDYLKLVYEAPSLTSADGHKLELVRVDNSTVKVKVGEGVPMMSPVDESIDGVAGAQWDGFLIATDFAVPSSSSISAIQMMLSQLIVNNGFSARSLPMFSYTNDGAIDDDGCLGPVNNNPGFNAATIEEKCPGVKNLDTGMYKYTFFAYQDPRIDCENCTLTFRNRFDVGIFSTVILNSAKTLDTIGTDQVSTIRFEAPDASSASNVSMYIELDLPSLVTLGRKDSQKSDPTGATITATKISDTSFYLDFAMAAPGPDQFAFYDPTVTGQGSEDAMASSMVAGFSTVLCILLVPLSCSQ